MKFLLSEFRARNEFYYYGIKQQRSCMSKTSTRLICFKQCCENSETFDVETSDRKTCLNTI